MDDEERAEALRHIRTDRLRRGGKPVLDGKLVRRCTAASHYLALECDDPAKCEKCFLSNSCFRGMAVLNRP